jgi:hypothetical protein
MPHLGLRDVPEEFESGGDFPEKIIAKCISCSRTQGRASCAALLRLPGHLQNLAVWSHVIDYYESSGHGLPHYVEWLEQHGYCGGVDWWPHGGRVQEFGSGRTRAEIMISLGRNPRIVPAHKLMDGISAARQTVPLAYFDAARCAKGLECLREYKAEWDDELRTLRKVRCTTGPRTEPTRFVISRWRGASRCLNWKNQIPSQSYSGRAHSTK